MKRLALLLFLLLAAPVWAQNLLQNPAAEDPLVGGEIPGWTEVAGSNWTYRSTSPEPHEGANYFFPGVAASAELAQDVDLSAFATAIDAGEQAFAFAGFVRSFQQSPADQTRIVVEYQDAEGAVLDSFDSGDIVSTTSWAPVTDQRLAPAGTRAARVRLIATRRNGSNNDGYFDALSLAPASSACTHLVVTAADSGPGSLRQAIEAANAAPDLSTICFAIPGAGPHTIALQSALPAITQPAVIDGYTQPGASANTLAVGSDAVIQVELDGSAAGQDAPGIHLAGSGITVRGLAVGNFDGDLVWISSGSENVVEGMFIGTDASGTQPRSGNSGAWVEGSAGNTIGGTEPAARNVISGDTGGGIFILADAPDTRILNNYVGTDPSGMAAVGENGGGIFVLGADDTVVGAPSAGNVIAGYDGGRLFVLVRNGDPAERTVIQGNYIGTNAAGSAALGDTGGGVFIDGAPNTRLGGTGEGEGNLISAGQQEGGVYISEEVSGGVTYTSAGTVVQGNLIGTDATGTVALNQCCGIDVSSPRVLIGGTEPSARNVISGNTSDGISVGDSVTVQGNYIGVDVTGTQPLGNGVGGIWVSGSGNVIGGAEPGAGNVIAATGPSGTGIIVRFGATGNVIAGNFIGTNAEGAEGLGNGIGISFQGNNTSGNLVGGMEEGAGNVIAHNTEIGVRLHDAGTGNAILGNRIYANGGLGISLSFSGPTENDPGDADEGPNGLQNFPVLTAAGPAGVTGTLDSTPSTTFRVELFGNAEADPSGYGEGEHYLGFVEVTTDASGKGAFSFDLPSDAPPSPFVTATATAPDGSTSEFSAVLAMPVSTEDAAAPAVFALHAAYPNPFANRATIAFDLPQPAPVRLVVYDVLGREVAVLAEGERAAGRHEAVLDAAGLPGGMYLVRLEAGAFAATQRVVLAR